MKVPARLGPSARRLPTVEQWTLAPAVMGSIDGEAEGAIPGFLHAPEDFFTPIQTAAHVELKDLWMVRARGDLFQARLGDGANEVHRAELGRGLRYRDSTLGSDRLQ